MLYGLETASLRKRQESELEVAELKMLRPEHKAKRFPLHPATEIHHHDLLQTEFPTQSVLFSSPRPPPW
ncbi:hypothetical protein QTP70_008278 [Hemibagrus guttatus]|uniref:Uncharacterized protein n=1 Tax=Hemibagrus guttatus TaxID=175788 RepID=A0AAE0RI19_9TELE|nr:hypothetical protein QTP70_008278 [Hemibagrus guttatus]